MPSTKRSANQSYSQPTSHDHDDQPPAKKRKITQFFDKDNASPSNSKSKKSNESRNDNGNECKENENDGKVMTGRIAPNTIFILAHGAGTNSQHGNIQNWKKRLQNIDLKNIKVITFDFKKPFAMAKLVSTYQSVIDDTIEKYGNDCNIILIGCSMGSRAAVNLALINGLPKQCNHVIALGYPLFVKKSGALRDELVLNFVNNKSINARLLLISGSKDSMAPNDKMNLLYNKVKDITINLLNNNKNDKNENNNDDNNNINKNDEKSKSKWKTKKKENNENESKRNKKGMKEDEKEKDLEKEKEKENDCNGNGDVKCVLKWIDGADHSLKVGKRHNLGLEKVHQNIIDIIEQFCFF